MRLRVLASNIGHFGPRRLPTTLIKSPQILRLQSLPRIQGENGEFYLT